MLKRTFLFVALSNFFIGVSFAEKAQDNIQSQGSKIKNTLPGAFVKMPEKYPTPEEIEKLIRIHTPKEWAKKQASQPQVAIKIPMKSPKTPDTNAQIAPKTQNTIKIRLIAVGKAVQDKLNEHRASDIQKMGINTKYSYNPKQYTMLPEQVRDIGLIGRVNSTSVGSLRIYKDVSSKAFADAYFQNHQFHSELFSAYLARKITLNNGIIGENITLYKAFIDELGYKFWDTPVQSVRSAKEAEETYLYILLRLTPSDRIQFWKYINTMRTGDMVNLPNKITIADVLTAEL